MLISIIIATYNAEKTLQRCLESIVRQMTDACELIIIDGGSSDNTKDIITSYGSKIAYTVSEQDKGVYDAWNKGIKRAKGQWILFIGADDMLEDGALNHYATYINAHPDLDFISAKVNYINEEGNTIAITGRMWNYNRCRINMDVTHVASLTNKDYFNRMGLFDVSYKIVGDYELLMRGGPTLRAGFLDHIVATMAIGGISFSVKGLKEQMRVKIECGNMKRVVSYLIYLYQLCVFYTYKLRHRG